MPQSKEIDRCSDELQRLLDQVQERLRFHQDRCIRLAAIRGALETELLRRGKPNVSGAIRDELARREAYHGPL